MSGAVIFRLLGPSGHQAKDTPKIKNKKKKIKKSI